MSMLLLGRNSLCVEKVFVAQLLNVNKSVTQFVMSVESSNN